MALDTSLEAAIEKHSTKVGLGPPAISKMELFLTLTVTKNSISDAAGVLDLPADINSLFVLMAMLTFRAYKKKLYHYFFYFLWSFKYQ